MLKRWFQEGYLSQILGSTSFHGSLVGQLPVAVAVERKIIVCWNVNLCLSGFLMISVWVCWLRIL